MAILLTLFPVNKNFSETPDGITIFLVSNGIHTDIVVPGHSSVIKWDTVIPPKHFSGKNSYCRYIGFGYGDKKFFTQTPEWSDLKLKTALKATFCNGPAAMHVTCYYNTPSTNNLVKRVNISKYEYQKLSNYIYQSFKFNKNKNVKHIKCCDYTDINDNFYGAKGTYHLIKTCNVWTNRGLKKAGIKTATWAPFDRCILYYH